MIKNFTKNLDFNKEVSQIETSILLAIPDDSTLLAVMMALNKVMKTMLMEDLRATLDEDNSDTFYGDPDDGSLEA